MFLNLLTSILISSCVSLGATQQKCLKSPKIENVQQVSVGDSLGVLSGGYYLKYTNDEQPYFTGQLFDHDVSVDFVSMFSTSEYENSTTMYFVNIDEDHSLFGTFDIPSTARISYDSDDNMISFDLSFYESDSFYCSIYVNDYFQDIGSLGGFDLSYIACYFIRYINVDSDTLALFNTLFSRTFNEHFVTYTGWYSFNTSGFVHQLGLSTIVGSLSANNTLFMSMSVSNYASLTVYFNSPMNTYDLIENDVFQSSNTRVYMSNVLITDLDFVKISAIGSFTYIPSSDGYTLSDLFFDIADTPIYFITSLFSFELFGIQFYIAFMGLVTILAMVFIIKKVI